MNVCLQEVFAREHQHNAMMTWALRVGGWALMFLGVSLTVRIVYTLGNTHMHTRRTPKAQTLYLNKNEDQGG